MTLIIEDGTVVRGSPEGSADANSYVTVVTFRAFFEARTDTVASDTAEDEEVESALIKGTDYMAQRLRLLWKGSRVEAQQPLDWPRRGVDVPDFFDPFFRNVNVPVSFQDTFFIPENEIPQEIKDCQMFLARATIDSSGVSSVENLQEALGRTTTLEKVGTLEVRYTDAQNSADSGRLTQFYYNAMKRAEAFILATAPHTGNVVRS